MKMQAYTVGFIGAGSMATAIIKGSIIKGAMHAKNISVFDIDTEKLSSLAQEMKITPAIDLVDLINVSDIIVLAVKPNVMATVLNEIKGYLGDKSVVSIAAGWSADMIRTIIGADKKVLRLMPNTPLMAGEGMCVMEIPHTLTDSEFEFIENLFGSLGLVEHAPAKAMDAVTAVSGSGPAYVYMFIEALSDAGVLCGLPRNQSTTLAAQTVLGAAKMVLETGRHPGALKDAVCSPGGTTIEAVKSLEQDGFRGAVINAVEQSANKSKSLNK
jgi:pyrroline-5-carboxylate reductase